MSAPSGWYELLIEGTGDRVDAIVSDRPSDERGIFRGEDLALHAGTFPERILELLGAKTHHLLFAPMDPARELIRRIETDPELRLERVREVRGASFAFEAEAYSHPVAEKIKKALHDDLPAGVSLLDCVESEEHDPSAKGVELYSPAHAYTYRATGRFTGPPPGIFTLHQRMQDIDFVKEKALEIDGREVASPAA
jgi:hypothetical protein